MRTTMIPLDMGELLGGASQQERRRTPDDVLALTLREIAAKYLLSDAPFKVGDLVTPRRGFITAEALVGRPHVVVEICPNLAERCQDQERGATWGIRVVYEGVVAMAVDWCEAWQFEPYTGPVARLEG